MWKGWQSLGIIFLDIIRSCKYINDIQLHKKMYTTYSLLGDPVSREAVP